jgi:hypothetical protein
VPPVIVAAITSLLGVLFGVFSIARALLTIALAGISYLLSPRPTVPDFAARQRGLTITIRDPVMPREIIYGRRRKGGTVAFVRESDSNSILHLVIVLAGHECEAIDEIYFNGDLAFDAAGDVQDPFTGLATVTKHLGAADQLADDDLIAAFPGVWTENHRLRGICYIYVTLTFDADVYRNLPNITAIVRGKKVYDPRIDDVVWSENAALCLADYLHDPEYGLAAPYGEEIATDDLIEAANICDEEVPTPIGTEPRYTANGVLFSSDEPQRNVEALLSAMRGSLVYTGGQWIIRAGAFVTPTVELDEHDLRGDLLVQARIPRRDLFNAIRGLYVSPEHDWLPTDFPAHFPNVYRDEDNGERIWRDIELPFTISPYMAQRLALLELHEGRQQISVIAPFSLKALRLRAGDTVGLSNARMGWSNKPFVVADWQFVVLGGQQEDQEEEAPQLGCVLQLRETSPFSFEFEYAPIFEFLPNALRTVFWAPGTASQYSVDSGETWGGFSHGMALTTTFWPDQAPGTLWTVHASTNKLRKSTNGGQTWADVGTAAPINIAYFSGAGGHVAMMRTSTGRIIVAAENDSGVRRICTTDDEGETWTTRTVFSGAGAEGIHKHSMWVVPSATGPETLYLWILSDGLFRSEDDGAMWTRVYNPADFQDAPPTFFNPGVVQSFVVTRAGALLLIHGFNNNDGSNHAGRVRRSTDRGATWATTFTFSGIKFINTRYRQKMAQAPTGLISIMARYHSTDDGVSFINSPSPPEAPATTGNGMGATARYIWWGPLDNGTHYRSADGLTWVQDPDITNGSTEAVWNLSRIAVP